MASRESLFIGIDVSKQTLDVAFGADPHAPRETIPYTDEGVQLLVTRLQRLQPTLIVLEATGRAGAHGVRPTAPGWLADGAGAATPRARPGARGRTPGEDRPRWRCAGCSPALPKRVRPPHHQATDEQRRHPCATCLVARGSS
jgi:transposase